MQPAAAILLTLTRFGLPGCSAPGQELAVRTAHLVCYDANRKAPVWTAYTAAPAARRPRHFRPDRSLTAASATDADYRHSGYSRGHLVPAADLAWSDEAVRDTFLLSNVVPQSPSLNLGRWRQLENAVRRLAARSDAAFVISGAIFCSERNERLGISQVAVPCELYKVVLAVLGSDLVTFAAILPNQANPPEPLARFITTAAEVERRTGLAFFPNLPPALKALPLSVTGDTAAR